MATSFKVKFRPSKVEGKEGSIYYQVIHRRMVRQISTPYHLQTSEWDSATASVIVLSATAERTAMLQMIHIYLAQIDTARVDRANKKILNDL